MRPRLLQLAGYSVGLPLLAAGLLSAGEAWARVDSGSKEMSAYRSMMARNCHIRPKSTGNGGSVLVQNIRLSEQWIRIRHVQKGWKGWVRVHAVCRVPGGTAWGYADLQLKSGQIKCESENWDSMIAPLPSLER